jgi:hypothetical protein
MLLPIEPSPVASAATRLRDAADWSYPGSTLTTPTTQAAGAGSEDPWDAGLAMEAAFGVSGVADGLAAPAPQPPQHQRQLAGSGLPPRGPGSLHPHHRTTSSSSAALEAAFAGADSRREAPNSAMPRVARTHSSSSAPAFIEAAEEAGAVEAVHAQPVALSGGTDSSSANSSRNGSVETLPPPPNSTLPAWQSPARIPPVPAVPPLPLSRLNSSSSAGRGGFDLEPLSATSASPPSGLPPPAPQPALIYRSGSGVLASNNIGSLAPSSNTSRRPVGLQQLDTESLTFETFGLESPDTITPGLQYARQVAQLFVEGRRRSHPGVLAASLAGTGNSTSNMQRSSSAATADGLVRSAVGGISSSESRHPHAYQPAPPWRPPNPT